MLRLVEPGGAHLHVRLGAQAPSDGLMHAVRINRGYLRFFFSWRNSLQILTRIGFGSGMRKS